VKAAVVTIGDELLIGQVVNTNAAWIGAELTNLGIRVTLNMTIGDEREEILEALETVLSKTDVVILTGGLGPTHDDVTKACVADYFKAALIQDDAILAEVKSRFERRNMVMPPSNVGQALVPEGFEAILNSAGSAPALIRQEKGSLLAVLPGVPHEMKLFMTGTVLPRIQKMGGLDVRCQKTLLVTGIGESSLQQHLDGLGDMLDEHRTLAFLPNLQSLRLRMTTTGEGAEERLAELEGWIRARASKWIYAEGDTSLEEVVGHLLKQKGLTLAVAESCTGGFVSHTITNVPGSSDYMLGGVVSYSNEAKQEIIGVNSSTIQLHGAVSKETAMEMAEGVRRALGASIGISTTGIMGPGGGTPEKPVGTVWLGISTQEKTIAVLQKLGSERTRNKQRAVTAILNLLRRTILQLED